MGIATLQDIIVKIRKLTGSGNTLQITDSMIIDHINSYYLYDFPAQFRSLKLKDLYTFNTIKGRDVYAFDSEHWSTVEMPCYVANREVQLFLDPWSFFGVNYNWQHDVIFATGDGGAGPYTGTLQANPLIRSSNNVPIAQTQTNNANAFTTPKITFQQNNISRVQNILISANTATDTLHVTDDGEGNLIGDVGGGANSIDYETGAISVTFNTVIPSGNDIHIQYNPQVQSIPLSILFFQNQFTLRPVPDRGYSVQLVAYRLPSQALLGTSSDVSPVLEGTPELNEWWELIAFGASKKIYQDRVDPEGEALMERSIQEMLDKAETRTYAQLGKQRINTMFSDQLQNSYGSTGWGFGNLP